MKKYLRIIFAISLVATFGSLYVEHFGDPIANIISGNLFDSSLGIVACNLCRYIRIFTYPVVILSAIGALFNDKNARRYIVGLAFICLLFCAYKFGLEMHWWSNGTDPFLCVNGEANCAEAKPLYFGVVSLSLLGFVMNIIVIHLAYKIKRINS